MPIATLIAGANTTTYNAVGIGITEQGFDLILALKEEVINESDVFGGSMIDFVYRGGDAQLRCDAKEYKAGSITPFWPWGTLGQMRNTTTPIGRLASDVAVSIVLTSTPNTPAAAAPASLTATKAIMAPGQQGTIRLTSKLRLVPLFFAFIPTDTAGDTRWFTTT